MKALQKIMVSLIFTLLIFTGVEALAQCSMCTLTAENSVQNGNTQGKGLNNGILLLLAAPYVAVGAVGYIWYTKYRRKDVPIDIKDEKINLN
jgi:heme/copper-type cytochrome/quinol oxidase subunit 2